MNEVIDLLNQLLQQASQLSDELSSEEQQMVLQIFTQAIEFIQSQQQGEGAPVQPPVSPVPPSEYESSNINGFKYDPDTQELLIQFHGPYPQAEGAIYSYEGVPKWLFDVISRGGVAPKTSGRNRYHEWQRGITPSLGAAVNALIKQAQFPYRRIS